MSADPHRTAPETLPVVALVASADGLDAPRVHFSRPSADVLLDSLARAGAPVIAVVLTGRGRDGAPGSLHVHRGGGTVLAQDRATSLHFGMPGAAASAGGVNEVLALPDIAPRLLRLLENLEPPAA